MPAIKARVTITTKVG